MKKTIVFLIMFLLPFFLSCVEVSASEKKKFNDFVASNREFSQTDDGLYTDKYYFKCVNYFNNGTYKQINNRFIKIKDIYRNVDSNYNVEVPQKLFTNNTIKR